MNTFYDVMSYPRALLISGGIALIHGCVCISFAAYPLPVGLVTLAMFGAMGNWLAKFSGKMRAVCLDLENLEGVEVPERSENSDVLRSRNRASLMNSIDAGDTLSTIKGAQLA